MMVQSNFLQSSDICGELTRATPPSPAGLSLQFPTRHERVISLKPAKAGERTVLRSLLARADEVVE